MQNLRPARIVLLAGLSVGLGASLGGCGLLRHAPPDNEPTLAGLAGRHVALPTHEPIQTDEAQAAAAYRAFLAAAPNAPQRSEAMRRLGDLAMDGADERLADGATPDYQAAIKRYDDFLKAYPNDPGNDRVLYQLARAHEQGGEAEVALQTLSELVQRYPHTRYASEAQFRRGELLFATRDYVGAESAYDTVLHDGGDTPYGQRALYMKGWSLFKQGRLDDALQPFFGVLDHTLGRTADNQADALSRGDRELVDDSLRVTSIALSNLQGAASIAPLIDSAVRRGYEYRVYQHLGEFYLKQQRVKDGADTFAAFARARPLDAHAPLLQARVIEIYAAHGFATLALQAKTDYVLRYAADSEFRRANPQGWKQAEPLLKSHLLALAREHHALAQQSKSSADAQAAVHWYRTLLASFPDDSDAAAHNFLLAELLFDARQFDAAAVEYEKVAYAYAANAHSADAGYAALLANAKLNGDDVQRASVASALRFAEHFAGDARCGGVLTHAADQLFALHDGTQSAALAQRALSLTLTAAERRTAWTVIAHDAFDRKAWPDAETAYAQALAAGAASSAAADQALRERQAAALYEQGDAARSAGRPRDALAFFERVARVAPDSDVRATAQFDAATALIAEKDWDGAERQLEDFRQRFPQHPLQAEVGAKLAAAYLATQQWSLAAGEFERVAASSSDAELARSALWQAAELHDRANDARTAPTYERYVALYPQPLPAAVQARYRLARLSSGQAALAWMKQVLIADASGGDARTDGTRALAAKAALALAEPVDQAFRQVALVEPLRKNLKLKKARMEEALQAYARAADYGVADVSTAATFRSAALYQHFGQALLASQRPKKLSPAELEQYDVMLEEQAFPFEEKAIALHELNAQRAAAGVYDESVRASFAALATLKPVRWAKVEREDAASPLNQQAITLRSQGEFATARERYEAAIAADPQAAAPVLNLAILNDLYLGNTSQALELYERFQSLVTPADGVVGKWLAELKQRKPEAVNATNATNAVNAVNAVNASSVVSRKEPR